MRAELEREINNLVIFKPYFWRCIYADFITEVLITVKGTIIEI